MEKQLKIQLKEFQQKLYLKELSLALDKLNNEFYSWKNNDIDAFELSKKIHQFQKEQAKDLYFKYELPSFAELNIIDAIETGLISKEDVPIVLQPMIERLIDRMK